MKSTAFVVNVARGGLIDEDALHKALVAGEIAGAGLDAGRLTALLLGLAERDEGIGVLANVRTGSYVGALGNGHARFCRPA